MIKTFDVSRSQFAANAAVEKQNADAREVQRVLRETRRAAEYPGYEPDLKAPTLREMTPEDRAAHLAAVGPQRYREQLRDESRVTNTLPRVEIVEAKPQPQIASIAEAPVPGLGGRS